MSNPASIGLAAYTPVRVTTAPTVVAEDLHPLQIVDASSDTHPGRARLVNGTIGGLLPTEMHVPDMVLPGGTDNHCYLTMSGGVNYVYGKLQVDSGTGMFTATSVYRTGSIEEPDGDYAYLLIGTVNYDSASHRLTITQLIRGSAGVLVVSSADGTLLQPYWSAGF